MTSPGGNDDFHPDRVAECLAGDTHAWEMLVRHFAPLVHSIPRRYGLTPEECDDVFQTSFAILFQRLGTIQDPQSLPKWLITTTTRECWRTLRRRDKSVSMDVIAPTADALAGPDALLLSQERDQAVAEAMGKLDERCRSLLRMLYTTTPTPKYAEIAETLGIAVGTIGPRRARCLRSLLELLHATPTGASILPEFE